MRKKMFWIGLGVSLVEASLLILMMVVAAPLKEILPLYAVLVAAIAVLSVFLVKKGQREKSDTMTLIYGLTAGMLWWTISEINADAFKGSGIENQAGLFLLLITFVVLTTCWKDINKTSKIAISTFMFNWSSHVALKMIMHMRAPTLADPGAWAGSPWNIFNLIGLIYGIVSIAAVIYIAVKAIKKGFAESKLHYYVLTMYVAVLNMLYIFVKHYFIIW